MQEDEDHDEDIYEETTSKIVYKRSSSTNGQDLWKLEDDEGGGSSFKSEFHFSRDGEGSESHSKADDEGHRKVTYHEEKENRSLNKDRPSYPEFVGNENKTIKTERYESEDKSSESDKSGQKRTREKRQAWAKQGKSRVPNRERPKKSYPVRPSEFEYGIRTRNPDEGRKYYGVTKWEVDYTNKNYIRSQCHKPTGLHRYILGKPRDWNIEYDNRHFLRSQVHCPKGLHRRGNAIIRKRVPDEDILGDSTGWEFEYGPEFAQVEEDIPFMPDENHITRGAYRYYGVRRNNSDSDRKMVDDEHEIDELIREELKYGPEFFQEDVPHIIQQKEQRIGRGGYRFFEAMRNAYDAYPEESHGVDYRLSQTTIKNILHDDSEPEQYWTVRKPFKRTIFKKTYEFAKPVSRGNARFATHLSFTPGEGSGLFYEGYSSRPSSYASSEDKRHYLRNAFKSTKNTGWGKQENSKENRKDYRSRDLWDLDSLDRDSHSTYYSFEDDHDQADDRRHSNKESSQGMDVDFFNPKNIMSQDEMQKKLPEHVQNRIQVLRDRMNKNSSSADHKKDARSENESHGKAVSFEKHKHHPQDRGQLRHEGYEKFISKNGSEIWIKREEKYSELHHRV